MAADERGAEQRPPQEGERAVDDRRHDGDDADGDEHEQRPRRP